MTRPKRDAHMAPLLAAALAAAACMSTAAAAAQRNTRSTATHPFTRTSPLRPTCRWPER